MKNAIKKILYTSAFLLISSLAYSQGPPPPGGPPDPGGPPGGPPVGSSPAGSGIVILLTLASAFGAIKVINSKECKLK